MGSFVGSFLTIMMVCDNSNINKDDNSCRGHFKLLCRIRQRNLKGVPAVDGLSVRMRAGALPMFCV